MGPVNWLAVVMAAMGATGVMALLQAGQKYLGTMRVQQPLLARLGAVFLAMLMASFLIGHNFARIGPDVLAAKPWLYAMMSGGWALMIALPVLYVALGGFGVPGRERFAECARWFTAFLAAGAIFWLMS